MDYTELMLKSRKTHIAHREFHPLIDLVTVKDALDFANWYHSDELSKLSQHDVSGCVHPLAELVSGDEGLFCCKCQKYVRSDAHIH